MAAALYRVIAHFQTEHGTPLHGDGYRVALFDQDLIKDDPLGESTPDAQGTVSFMFSRADFRSADSPLENDPDLYFVVQKDGAEIHRTAVAQDVKFTEPDPATKRVDGMTRAFGPFRVPGT